MASETPPEEGFASNDDIIAILDDLMIYYLIQDDKRRAEAFERAIESIRVYPFYIHNGAEAKTLRGIGDGIATRIELIRTTGSLPEHNALMEANPGLFQTVRLFRTIYGVGPKTAAKWYKQGLRTLEELNPQTMTRAQAISWTYRNETNQRIPRDEIVEFENALREYTVRYTEWLKRTHNLEIQFEFVICGSYRRGLASSNDIDVALNVGRNDPKQMLEAVLRFPMFRETLAKGIKKATCLAVVRNLHRQIDIELCRPEEMGPALVYFTGSKNFNIRIRQRCSYLGMRLNEKSLISPEGYAIYIQDERHLFQILGIAYVEPKDRNW